MAMVSSFIEKLLGLELGLVGCPLRILALFFLQLVRGMTHFARSAKVSHAQENACSSTRPNIGQHSVESDYGHETLVESPPMSRDQIRVLLATCAPRAK